MIHYEEFHPRVGVTVCSRSYRGFTLIELSIVLVIIGLIVGGVLVGRDLISAAESRKLITQIEQYKAAVYAFKLKYQCLPGDCINAANYGFAARGPGFLAGWGNGDELLEARNGMSAFGTYQSKGETALFWRDLSEAKMISENLVLAGYNDQTLTGGGYLNAASTPNLDGFFPRANIGKNNWLFVYSLNSQNYFGVSADASIQPNGPTYSYAGIRVNQANSIDSKTDDGHPQNGMIIARGMFNDANSNWAAAPNAGEGLYVGANPGVAANATQHTCYDNGNNASNPMQYTMSQNSGNGINCALSFKAGF